VRGFADRGSRRRPLAGPHTAPRASRSAFSAGRPKSVGARGLSGFVTRAMRHELEREQLGAFVVELDEELGAVSKKSLAEARAAWLGR
jgi:hypothetical protein